MHLAGSGQPEGDREVPFLPRAALFLSFRRTQTKLGNQVASQGAAARIIIPSMNNPTKAQDA